MRRKGFAGLTHVLIAMFCLLLILYLPIPLLFEYQNKILSVAKFCFLVIFIVSGASLFPDLDNNRSTAYFQLGLFGKFSYRFMYFTSNIAVKLRTRKDYIPRSLHRCLWHTLLIPFLIWLLFRQIPKSDEFYFKTLMSIKEFVNNIPAHICVFLAICSVFMALVVILIRLMHFCKKSTYTIIRNICLVILSSMILTSTLDELRIIGNFVATGYALHIFADLFSELSAPAFWPLKIKGCFWYRPKSIIFGNIETNGTVNKALDWIFAALDILLIYVVFIHENILKLIN